MSDMYICLLNYDIQGVCQQLSLGIEPNQKFFNLFFDLVNYFTHEQDKAHMEQLLHLGYFIQSCDHLGSFLESEKLELTIQNLRENLKSVVVQHHQDKCIIF